MADPVSYTKASSYRAATEGLAICDPLATDIYNHTRKTHNGDAVVINMGHFMELFLDLSVLSLWPEEVDGSAGALLIIDSFKGEVLTYSTPPGWRLVLLTLFGLIIVASELEW